MKKSFGELEKVVLEGNQKKKKKKVVLEVAVPSAL